MNNERYNQIIDEAYRKWLENCNNRIYPNINEKEQFINRIKTDPGFSERWGLKIEERELNDDSRNIFFLAKMNPTKLIKVTYENETIEVYE